MPPERRLRIFVAMAFGHSDVDAVFDRVIKPVVRRERLGHLVRVDRSDSNDAIDDQIHDEMNKCDMCIADLTFARPSVYFEAGFVRGLGKPVVFTCRNDHFARVRTEAANADTLRVHFDLEQESILGWRRPRDDVFGVRLLKRLRRVARPLLQERLAASAMREKNAQFALLSPHERKALIEQGITSAFQQERLRLVRRGKQLRAAWKVRGQRVHMFHTMVDRSWSRRSLVLARVMSSTMIDGDDKKMIAAVVPAAWPVRTVLHTILASEGRISKTTLESAFSDCIVDPITGARVCESSSINPERRFAAFDQIRSNRDAIERVRAYVKTALS